MDNVGTFEKSNCLLHHMGLWSYTCALLYTISNTQHTVSTTHYMITQFINSKILDKTFS